MTLLEMPYGAIAQSSCGCTVRRIRKPQGEREPNDERNLWFRLVGPHCGKDGRPQLVVQCVFRTEELRLGYCYYWSDWADGTWGLPVIAYDPLAAALDEAFTQKEPPLRYRWDTGGRMLRASARIGRSKKGTSV